MSEKVCKDLMWYRKKVKISDSIDKSMCFLVKDPKDVPKDRKVHHGFKMDSMLKTTLDSIIYGMKKDLDFVILITGEGDVRVGKSVLAMQIAYYVASRCGSKFDIDHVCFTSKNLMKMAQEAKMPTNSVFIYDEAREAFSSDRAMEQIQKQILQFFAECGQLNDLFILVLPSYFDLRKSMAIERAELLLTCYFQKKPRKDELGNKITEKVRGNFRFFRNEEKKMLYLKGKQTLNYKAWRPRGIGGWNDIYTIEESLYREKKKQALKETSFLRDKKTLEDKWKITSGNMIKALREKGWKWHEISAIAGKTERWAQKTLENVDFGKELGKKDTINPYKGLKMPDIN